MNIEENQITVKNKKIRFITKKRIIINYSENESKRMNLISNLERFFRQFLQRNNNNNRKNITNLNLAKCDASHVIASFYCCFSTFL